jgi:hypothetical protein
VPNQPVQGSGASGVAATASLYRRRKLQISFVAVPLAVLWFGVFFYGWPV